MTGRGAQTGALRHGPRLAQLTLLLATTSVAAQVTSAFDDGAILGRVCLDVDGDGACSADEPGVAGARVFLETGLFAVTDAQGRYHLAAVPARTPQPEGRLATGRHRVKVDARTLAAGALVRPNGATLEVPFGALVARDFAVSRPAGTAAPVTLSAEPARGELRGGRTSLRLAGAVEPGTRLIVGSAPVATEPSGRFEVWVPLEEGPNAIALITISAGGQVSVALRPVELVRREGSVLVVPGALARVVGFALPGALTAGALIALDGEPGVQVQLGQAQVSLDGEGRAVVSLPAGLEGVLPVQVRPPRGPALAFEVPVEERRGVFLDGLLDLEAGYVFGKGVRLAGRGAGVLRASVKGFELGAELDLRDRDLEALRTGQSPLLLATARRAEIFERVVDPLRATPQFGDDAAAVASNPGEGRVRLEVSREGVGSVGYGSRRAWFGDSEVGRFHRSLTAGYLDVRTPDSAVVQGRATGFASPSTGAPEQGLSRAQAHDRLEATGGSLYFLPHGEVVQGSELVRVEVRDGLTGLPLAERHLRRGVDYSIDYASGRILLAQPLSLFAGASLLRSEALSSWGQAALLVDSEYLVAGPGESVVGGAVEGRFGPVRLSGGAAAQGTGYSLLRARALVPTRWGTLTAELARSAGALEGLSVSNDGGLTSAAPPLLPVDAAEGWALVVRARGEGWSGKGFYDLAYRRRSAGFQDSASFDPSLGQQLSARVEQPLGPVTLAALVDFRDPGTTRQRRVVGGAVGYDAPAFGVRLEARDVDRFDAAGRQSGTTTLGLAGRVRVLPELTLTASWRQPVSARDSARAAPLMDDAFGALGADVAVDADTTVGLRAGWGPKAGVQVWGQASARRGEETWYGQQSFDVDSPSTGERRFVLGARREVGPGSAVYVEDVGAHDQTGLRLARAVGLVQAMPGGLQLSARYERGVRELLTPTLQRRDTAGLSASWERERLRLFARAELRDEASATPNAPGLRQWLGSGGGEVRLRENLRLTLMGTFAHTARAAVLLARLFEGSAALAFRVENGAVLLRYTLLKELKPSEPQLRAERTLHLASLMPGLHFGDRVTVAAGLHLGLTTLALGQQLIVSGSLRPGVRVVGGLELAVEGAARTAGANGGLVALRGEAGWRFDDRFLLAAGYSFFGFSGLGVDPALDDSGSRAYLRAEVGY